MGLVLLFVVAAIVLVVVGFVINGLTYLLVIGLFVLLLTLIIGAARYLGSGWRR